MDALVARARVVVCHLEHQRTIGLRGARPSQRTAQLGSPSSQHLAGLEAEEAKSSGYAKLSGVKATVRTAEPRTAEQAAGKAAGRERREAYVRGHQLAEMGTTNGLTRAELADVLGVSRVRISKIEHGEIAGINVVRAYVAALGGSIDVVAWLGDRSWKVA